jgi:amidase
MVIGATTTELHGLSAGELAGLIQLRQVSSREVIEALLARIAQVNPKLNALTVVLAEQALAAADLADRAIAAGERLGPFHGVPFTVKENIDLGGSATSQGVAVLASADPGEDAPQVGSLKAAGAIPLARSNLPDFALRWHTDNDLRGATRNPWDAGRTPGGSSGGEAVALATGMTPLGLGNDVGGSLRWPSQCNGTVALKPTLGRIPHATRIEPVDGPIGLQIMAVEGPMARSVTDLRLAMKVLIEPSWRDPWQVPVPFDGPPFEAPIRVAVVKDPGGLGTSAQVAEGVDHAARTLAEACYAVEEVEPPRILDAAQAWLDLLGAEIHMMWPQMKPIVSAGANQFMLTFLEMHPQADLAAYAQSLITRSAILREWAEFQQRYPLIVAPICTEPPFAVGTDLEAEGIERIRVAMRMVVAVNLLGVPAVAVPVGSADGLPQVVQIVGRRYREDSCLDAAEAIEQRRGRLTPIDPR